MGIFSFLGGISRENMAEKLGLLGRDLDDPIDALSALKELHGVANPIVAAIGELEQDMLLRHAVGEHNERELTHVIVESFYLKKCESLIDPGSGTTNYRTLDGIRARLRKGYDESNIVKYASFRLVDRMAVVDELETSILASIPVAAENRSLYRDVLRLAYETKVAIIKGKF